MVSMEERLAKSAKAKKSETSIRKSKKSKRAKTAGKKTKVRRNLCLLTCIKPQNLDEEKAKFFQSNFTYNPQFKYEYPASETILARFSKASAKYLPQVSLRRCFFLRVFCNLFLVVEQNLVSLSQIIWKTFFCFIKSNA